ncbi:MAG: hypothetical protein M5U34_31605 [Chloroflexi bacterium]|nr:hypothetical protein [Chloroflexota bacterium]
MPLIAPDEIVWTPDGSGATATGGGGMAYGVVGGELLDLETAVGLQRTELHLAALILLNE